MNAWESIFSQSPVNEGYYNEQRLPLTHWGWPRGTWLQSRLDFLRDQTFSGAVKSSRKFKEPENLRSI